MNIVIGKYTGKSKQQVFRNAARDIVEQLVVFNPQMVATIKSILGIEEDNPEAELEVIARGLEIFTYGFYVAMGYTSDGLLNVQTLELDIKKGTEPANKE
jgi:hypothetical protein